MTPDETGTRAASITWIKISREASPLTHPGAYCLRSNETTWDAVPNQRHIVPLIFMCLSSQCVCRLSLALFRERQEEHLVPW